MSVVVPSQQVLSRLLREKLRRHNRNVLLFSLLSAAGATISWALLYQTAKWLSLLFAAIIKGPYATVPGFGMIFTAGALALMFSAWLDRKVTTNDLPPDAKSAREIAMDFVYAVPRMTLAISGNLSAWLKLAPAEVAAAASLLERITERNPMPIHEAPLEIPDDRSRENVITALVFLGLVEFQRADNAIFLRVPLRVREDFGFPALQ